MAGSARPSSTKAVLGMAAAAVLAAGVVLLLREDRVAGGDGVGSVLDRADELVGDRVTVTGRVGEVISAKSFTLTDDGGRRLLVLDVSTIPAVDDDLDGLVTDELVEVGGVVRTFRLEEIERHVGELIDGRYEPFVGRPVVLADGIVPR